MKKALALLLLLAAAGIPSYLWVKGSLFGVSDRHPLGRFDLIDAWLQQRKCRKEKAEVDERIRERFGEELAGAQLWRYEHADQDRWAGRPSEVAVALDARGDVKALRAQFFSGIEVMAAPTSAGESIAGSLWLDVAGAKPSFEEQMVGKGRFARHQLVARCSRGRAQGTWTKRYDSGQDARTIWDEVVYVVR